ncbi:hypothetical protein CL656_05400 [bacterium]|nr:hypothetical protein [bacterium]|tara:strand:+ start:214 stop:726 length:513 start_codon:yes stop_codon:yes gene_type:complete
MNYNNNQNNILLNKLLIYYQEDNNMQKLINILNETNNISLRLIDWFVTNYSKTKYISYTIDDKTFNVFQSYKLMGKSFKKKKFDPFCRGDRILLTHDNQNFETTIGQLNFFKWAFTNNIVDYIIQNREFLKNEHTNFVKENKNKIKNKNVDVNAILNVYDKNVEIVASFN